VEPSAPPAVTLASKLNLFCDFITLTFDLSVSIWGHGSSILPANFKLAIPFRSRLMVRYRTDEWPNRQTDNDHQRLMPPPYGVGVYGQNGDKPKWQQTRTATLH